MVGSAVYYSAVDTFQKESVYVAILVRYNAMQHAASHAKRSHERAQPHQGSAHRRVIRAQTRVGAMPTTACVDRFEVFDIIIEKKKKHCMS